MKRTLFSLVFWIAVIFLWAASIIFACSKKEDYSELSMITICVDGVLQTSSFDGGECRYIPLTIEGATIECKESK